MNTTTPSIRRTAVRTITVLAILFAGGQTVGLQAPAEAAGAPVSVISPAVDSAKSGVAVEVSSSKLDVPSGTSRAVATFEQVGSMAGFTAPRSHDAGLPAVVRVGSIGS